MQATKQKTRWRPIPGAPTYQASQDGRIRRQARVGKDGKRYKARELKPTKMTSGYLCCRIQRRGVWKTEYCHRLVYLAWSGPIRKGNDISHLNSVKHDNRRFNLRAMSRREHSAQAGILGERCRGTRHPNAILNAGKVRSIFRRRAKGERQIDIAARYGVSKYVVRDVLRRKSWKHVDVGRHVIDVAGR